MMASTRAVVISDDTRNKMFIVLLCATLWIPLHSASTAFLTPCADTTGLTPHQVQYCKEHPDIVDALAEGFNDGYAECQRAFEASEKTETRWNCVNSMNPNKSNVMFGVPQPRDGSKEAGVMQLFTAAGMLYNLVKKCQQGELRSCSPTFLYTCGPTSVSCKHINWDLPMRFLRLFFAIKHDKTFKEEIEGHNRKLAFRMLKKNLIYMSETCDGSFPLCYDREDILPIKNLNRNFIDKYKESIKVRRKVLVNRQLPSKYHVLHRNTLLHYRVQFNYCTNDNLWNWKGIGRRSCQVSTPDTFAMNNCRNLCCGFGYITVVKVVKKCRVLQTKNYEHVCRDIEEPSYLCKFKNETRQFILRLKE